MKKKRFLDNDVPSNHGNVTQLICNRAIVIETEQATYYFPCYSLLYMFNSTLFAKIVKIKLRQ